VSWGLGVEVGFYSDGYWCFGLAQKLAPKHVVPPSHGPGLGYGPDALNCAAAMRAGFGLGT